MKKAIFNTKIVKVIDYVGNDMYLIEFKNKKRIKVYANELVFIGNESLYD